MITVDSDPKLNPISIGASVLRYIAKCDYTEVEIEVVYNEIKEKFNASYDVFAYTLDWLFVAGAIELSEQGKIKYASA